VLLAVAVMAAVVALLERGHGTELVIEGSGEGRTLRRVPR
jgi:hypothetical protein